MDRMIDIPVEGRMTGRNGTFDLRGVRLFLTAIDEVMVDGVGKRGLTITGGFRLTYASLDAVCRKYLERRGWTLVPPTQEGAHAV